jgi:methyltransferase, fkbM family
MGNQKETAVRLLSENFTAVMEARSAWRAAVQQMFRDGEPVYLWGTGQMGQWAAHLVRDMGGQLAAFVDNNAARWGTEMEGVSCISPEQLREAADPLVVIGVGMSGAAVAAQLADMNIRRVLDMPDFYLNSLFDDLRSVNPADVAARVERCFDLLADERSRDVLLAKLEGFFKFEPGFGNQKYYEDVCQGDQYFQDDIIRFTEASVLVDCGAYTGDTMEDFLRRGYPFRKYIAYELTQQNYSVLQENMKNVREGGAGVLVAHNCGVGERNEQIYYDDVVSASSIATSGTRGEIVRMDDHLQGEDVSFIKMDIEGAERAALRGAEQLIRRCRPDLAICVYHSISDLFEIPLYIHSIVPEYRLYLRHHTPVFCETVCYAVI